MEETMERITDNIQVKEGGNFEIEDFQVYATRPLKALVDAIVEEDCKDRFGLCMILREQIYDLDECIDRLLKERLKSK